RRTAGDGACAVDPDARAALSGGAAPAVQDRLVCADHGLDRAADRKGPGQGAGDGRLAVVGATAERYPRLVSRPDTVGAVRWRSECSIPRYGWGRGPGLGGPRSHVLPDEVDDR